MKLKRQATHFSSAYFNIYSVCLLYTVKEALLSSDCDLLASCFSILLYFCFFRAQLTVSSSWNSHSIDDVAAFCLFVCVYVCQKMKTQFESPWTDTYAHARANSHYGNSTVGEGEEDNVDSHIVSDLIRFSRSF